MVIVSLGARCGTAHQAREAPTQETEFKEPKR